MIEFIHSSIDPSIYPSIHPFIHPSIHPFIHLMIHSFIHLFIHLFAFFNHSIHCRDHSSIHLFIHSFIRSFIVFYSFIFYHSHLISIWCGDFSHLCTELCGCRDNYGVQGTCEHWSIIVPAHRDLNLGLCSLLRAGFVVGHYNQLKNTIEMA